MLTVPVPIPDKGKKLTQIFMFTLLCGASKGFMKALESFIKSFEAPQKIVKIKIKLIFILMQLFEMSGARRLNADGSVMQLFL